MTLKRRGAVFLISSLLLISVFLVLYFGRTLPTQEDLSDSVATRIRSIDDFIKDVHRDVPRATYIAGYRSLLAMEEYVAENGYITPPLEPGDLIVEAFLNGTIDGENYTVLENSTFPEYLQRVNQHAESVGIALNITIGNVSLEQRTPWSVHVTFPMELDIRDTRGLASWDLERDYSVEVSILDTRDPLYTVNTFGRVPNTFRRSPHEFSSLVVGDNDTSNLFNETVFMYYREDPYAPSYLQRLRGDLSANPDYGVSSVVNLDALNAQGLFVYTYRSVIDYLYFSNASVTTYCPQKGEPLQSWWKLDAQHYNDEEQNYELDDLNATTCT